MKLPKETSGATNGASRRHGKWYDDACGTAFAMELVGERWSLLIVRELMFGGRRFSDLRAGLPGISAKVLTERLEGLERAGIVGRAKLPPPAAAQVYELTELGYAAEPAIMALGRWAAQSRDHDPTLPLSAASLGLSLRTMFDSTRAVNLDLSGTLRMGDEPFRVGIAAGRLAVERGEAADPHFTLSAGSAMPIAAAIYGKVPLDELAGAGLAQEGSRAVAQAFINCFHLPEKLPRRR